MGPVRVSFYGKILFFVSLNLVWILILICCIFECLGSSSSLIQRKGKRQQFATYQTLELERQFQLHRYLTRNRKMELSRSIALTERQVEVWFQNRRAKRKRQMRDLKDVNKNRPNIWKNRNSIIFENMTVLDFWFIVIHCCYLLSYIHPSFLSFCNSNFYKIKQHKCFLNQSKNYFAWELKRKLFRNFAVPLYSHLNNYQIQLQGQRAPIRVLYFI